jgi:hypothetical protein
MTKVTRVKSFCKAIDNNVGDHTCDEANKWLRNHPEADLKGVHVALADGKGYMFLMSLVVEIDEALDTDQYLIWS